MRRHHEHQGRDLTDIDPGADIELTSSRDHVTARIPLAGQVTGEWLGCYHRLARAAAVPVRAEVRPERTWIVVTVPATSSHAEIAGTLDAALALITEADTAALRAAPTAQAEASIRDWWARTREGTHRRPMPRVDAVRTAIGGEKRWLLAAALALAMAVSSCDRSATAVRSSGGCCRALVLILVGDAVFVTVRLVVDLVEGGPETDSAADLLGVGFGVWIYTIVAFAFLYWLFRAAQTRSSPRRAGVRSSPTISTWGLPTPPRSARPM